MADLCACRRTRERCTARICKQIQHANGAPCIADRLLHPVPVDRLLRKQSRMLETGRAHDERQITVADLPALGRLFAVFPLSAAGFGAVIVPVRMLPQIGQRICLPDDLRIGTDQRDIAPALQTLAGFCINQAVIRPVFCNSHR